METFVDEIEPKEGKLSVISKTNATIIKDLWKSFIFPSLFPDREQCRKVWDVLLLAVQLIRIKKPETLSTSLKGMPWNQIDGRICI